MADHAGNSQVAGPSNRAIPESPLDSDESDSDSVSDCGSSGGSVTPVPRKQPSLVNRTLTFWFPLPTTISCPHDGCPAKFRVKLWTSAKQSVVRHIRDLHEEADSTVVRCVGCRSVLGIRPGAHKCRFNIEAAEDVVGQHACTVAGCEMSFPTKQGLANHLRNHRRQVIVEAAAVPLPLPATRQRLRANPAPIPTRGGDAQVPVVQTVDVPRIPAGNRPPDTGGPVADASVRTGGVPRIPAGNRPPATGGTLLPPTPRAGPRRPGGSRPPDTGGSASNPTGSAPRIPAGTRPPDTGGAHLSPQPNLLPTAMRQATPMRPRGAGDRLSLPLPPHSPLRTESPRNEGYSIVVASPELWRPRDPSPVASDSSASSGAAAGDDGRGQ
ncbi:unnamed protein product [Macrosiphum euphorbiae]|uniref:C2H2-type domain-containing protein n=1 Tax=Macrosiphum euphorbiae TaxID=13131 RepID=A0AAV0VT85_9HEMI|nr:unnamed protein product [Macrosiphum euphorbiae]